MRIKNIIWLVILLLISCNDNIDDLESAKNTVDKFYKFDSNKDYKLIDDLISIQFFRVTPYNKFIDFLKYKKQKFGKIKEKHLESYKIIFFPNSKNQIFLKYKIKYKLIDTEESFLLQKNNGVFEIVKYSLLQTAPLARASRSYPLNKGLSK